METKKSIVSKILHNTRSYQSQNGTLYVHDITFDNGDRGTYSAKTETCQKFTEGQEASYTIEKKVNGQYTNVIIKPATEFVPNGQPFAKKTGSDESFALSYAKDWACSRATSIGHGITTETILQDAEKFFQWLKSKK